MMHKVFLMMTLFIFACGKVEIPEDLQEYIKDLHTNCLEENGLNEDNHKAYDINTKDPKIMCYMKCLLLKSKWMSTDERIQYDYILDSIHPSVKPILQPALDKCHDISSGSMNCEKAYNFNLCLYNADPENWMLL